MFDQNLYIHGVKIIDANQDGHKDIYFLSKGSGAATDKINEEIYFNDGNGYFDNNICLGCQTHQRMLSIIDIDSDGNSRYS